MSSRKDIDRLKSEMEELFADLCQVPRLVAQRTGFRPPVDVYFSEEPPMITVVVELAGVDPGEVEVAVADNTLVLRGKRRRGPRDGRVYRHMEIDYGSFERRIPLPEAVDSEAAQADYEHGMLSIRMPLIVKQPGPVRVEVKRDTA
jgi:HSP20 family protein